ncbi:condensation domain-containing protein, partial [Rheinheimera gaetbuli]
MTIAQFIKQLRNSGVHLELQQQQLRCELPANGISSELRAEIVARKDELKQYLLRHNVHNNSVTRRDSTAACKGGIPLSCNQQVLWTDQQVHGCRSAFHMPFAFRLRGELRRDALQHALDSLVARHEVLRTVYRADKMGTASQFVQDAHHVEIRELKLDAPLNNQTMLPNLLQEDICRPFELSTDLMLRVTLVMQGPQEHLLLLTLHHIASDGWSMALMLQEFNALYNGFIAGELNPLPDMTLQYADYALWQREWLDSDSGQQSLDYWKQQLSNLPVLHSLKLDYQRPETPSFKGATLRTVLEPKVLNDMREFCRQEGATLFMGLHTIFSVVLARFSGERDIVMGASAANRGQPELSGLIGFFVNMLVLRNDVSSQATLRSLLQQSKQTMQDAYAHQQVPLVKLFEALKPARSLSHNPLFQILLVLQNNEQVDLNLTALDCQPLAVQRDGSKYDLTLGVLETPEGLLLDWEYNSDLFSAETISDIARYFNSLMVTLLASSDTAIEDLQCLDQLAQGKLSQWQGEGADVTDDVWSLFEQQV